MFTSLISLAGFCSPRDSFRELAVAIVLLGSVVANVEELADEKKWNELVLSI